MEGKQHERKIGLSGEGGRSQTEGPRDEKMKTARADAVWEMYLAGREGDVCWL